MSIVFQCDTCGLYFPEQFFELDIELFDRREKDKFIDQNYTAKKSLTYHFCSEQCTEKFLEKILVREK